MERPAKRPRNEALKRGAGGNRKGSSTRERWGLKPRPRAPSNVTGYDRVSANARGMERPAKRPRNEASLSEGPRGPQGVLNARALGPEAAAPSARQ
jgi:hypothetical protein